MKTTTRKGLQERQDTPLVLTASEELLNSMSLKTNSNVNSPIENSKPLPHLGSGYNLRKESRLSAKHPVFVLGTDGHPLTPTTSARAKKLLKQKQAKPVWNKFGKMGLQMLVTTRKETPKTALGVDFGTKFEGYSLISGRENTLNVMWKLPDKKKIVKKLEERRILRRARRFRNCRRRECRFDNRERKGFIAPSQMVIVNSRLKAINEFFGCYPIDAVALEDVRFNHSKKRYGKNFSTVEVGKQKIKDWISKRAYLHLFSGYDTEDCRERYGYSKSGDKSSETFNSHCSDALALAVEISSQQHIEPGDFIVADDTYMPVRRRLHDTEFAKGGIRDKYSTGNFRGIRKGTMCNFGQVCGGIKENIVRTYDWNSKRLSKSYNSLMWLSHNFKCREVSVNSPHG